MPDLIRLRLPACLFAVLVLAVSAAGIATAQESPTSREVTVDLRMPLNTSNAEVAISHAGRRYLPSLRFLTPQASADRPGEWLRSSAVDLPGIEGGVRAVIRILPASTGDGQVTPERYDTAVEYAGRIILPSIRRSALNARAGFLGRWVSSSPVTLPAAPQPEEPETGTDSGPDSETETGGTNTGEGEGTGGTGPGEQPDEDGDEFAFTSAPSNQTFTEGAQITPVILPDATGGEGSLRYSLIHRIRGLSFAAATRTLSGTPQTAGEHLVFYTANDAAGAVVNATFTITVNPAGASTGGQPSGPDTRPSFGGETIAPQTWTVGVAITPLTLPAADLGNAPLRYNLDPAIPGISFNGETRSVTGAPARAGNFSMRYSVTDADLDGASIEFPVQIAAEADSEPQFPAISLNFDFVVGESQRVTLPLATGGNGSLAYSLAPNIPGMAFDVGTRTLSGTPAAPNSHRMLYVATDADGDTASLTFMISVSQATGLRFTTPASLLHRVYDTGVNVSAAYPAATGGTAPISYSLTPDVPGMTFNAAARTHSGAPDQAGNYRMTYTATGADGNTAHRYFTIQVSSPTQPAVSDDLRPSFNVEEGPDVSGTVGQFMTISLPTAIGGNGALTYTINWGPRGVGLAADTAVFSGRPAAPFRGAITLTATDEDGDRVSINFIVRIAAAEADPSAPPPASVGPRFPSASLNRDFEIDEAQSLTLPEAVGGNAPLAYSLTPSVPGLAFNPATRAYSGTPERAGTYWETYTVADADGASHAMTFLIRVRDSDMPDLKPSFGGDILGDFYGLIAGSPFTAYLLTATGGNPPLTYSLTGAPGMSVPPAGGRINGTPERAGTFRVTYTVTDADGDTASTSGEMVVSAPPVSEDADAEAGEDGGAGTGPGAGSGANVGPQANVGVPEPDTSPSFTASGYTCSGAAGIALSCTLPAASGGNAPLTYSLSAGDPAAPITEIANLRFDPSARALAGTPSAAGEYSAGYIATDADGDTADIVVRLNIGAAPAVDSSPSFGSITHVVTGSVGRALSSTFPAATGGNGDLRYRIATDISGLSFDPATRVFSGTPRSRGDYRVLYSAADEDGDAALMAVSVRIAPADTAPQFTSQQRSIEVTDGDSWSVTLPAATGGNGALVYSLSSGNTAVRFNPVTRQIYGARVRTLGQGLLSRTDSVTYSVVDSDSNAAASDGDQLTFYLVTRQSRPVSTGTSPSFATGVAATFTGTVGEEFSATLPAATGGDGTLAYSLETVPQGLSLNALTRVLSGTPRAAGNHTIRYTATDDDGERAVVNVIIRLVAPEGQVVDQTPTFSLQVFVVTGTVGQALSTTLPAASGGDGGLTYTLSSQIPGLALSRGLHTLSGTPTNAQNFTIRYIVTDEDGDSGSMSLNVQIAPDPAADSSPAFTSASFAVSTTAGPGLHWLSRQLPAATGGNGTLAYSLTTPPQGLTFNPANRRLYGRAAPSTAGAHSLTYKVTDADGDSATMTVILRIAAGSARDLSPSWGSVGLRGFSCRGKVGTALSCALPAASGGDGALTYSLATPPRSLVFNASTRVLSGTPIAAGRTFLAYNAEDSDGDDATFSIVVIISAADADLTPAFSASSHTCPGTAGTALSCTLPAASGGDGTLTYSLATPPQGLAFTASSRTLSGTPDAAGTTSLTYTATDSDGDDATLSVSVQISAAATEETPVNAPTFSVESYACSGTIGVAVSCTLPAGSGGDGRLTYWLGTLPEGFSFHPVTRVLSGSSASALTRVMTYDVADRDWDSDRINVTLTIASADRTPSFSTSSHTCSGTVNQALSCTLPVATGGDGSLSYTVARKPQGVVFASATRALSGTPRAAGTSSHTYTATDSDGDSATMTVRIVISAAPAGNPAFSVSEFSIDGTVGVSLSTTLPAATGGTGTLTYSLASPPQGLSFNAATRVLSGSPEASGAPIVTYTVTDANGNTDALDVQFDIAAAPVVTPDRSPAFSAQSHACSGTAGAALSCTLPAATGGDGTLAYSLASPPQNLVFTAATRLLSGTPAAAGTSSLTYTATDGDGDAATMTVTLTIASADRTPSFSASTHSCYGTVNEALSCTLPAATGGDGTLTYTVARKPQGVVFASATRSLSGTPRAAGNSSHTYTATDSDGDSATMTVRIVISAAPESNPAFSVTEFSIDATVGVSLSMTLPSATGGTGTLTYSLASPPQGLSFNAATRVLSGSPDASGAPTVTYTVTDANGNTDALDIQFDIQGS